MAFIEACGNNKPNECVMIGDDLVLDIEGAQNAGLHTIFVNHGKINKPKDIVEVECVEDITAELIDDLFTRNTKGRIICISQNKNNAKGAEFGPKLKYELSLERRACLDLYKNFISLHYIFFSRLISYNF